MTKAKGYSIWLIPTDNIYKKLHQIVLQLSKKYSTPSFEPHITLLDGFLGSKEEILSNTEQLTHLIRPFTIRLTHADYLDQYFRCLFLRAEKTIELMNANDKAREIFNRKQDPKFMPHLSLMYGDFTPETKEQIIETIDREFNISFNVRSIHLFSTDGKPKDWYRVGEFSLK